MTPLDFVQVFRARQIRFAELLRLSLSQKQFIEDDDYPQLLTLLGTKQRLIEDLDEINRAYPRLGERWRNQRDRMPVDTRRECDQLLAQSETLLAHLAEHERVCGEELVRRRDETRLQLQAVSAGGQAQSAYGDVDDSRTHRHLDLDQ